MRNIIYNKLLKKITFDGYSVILEHAHDNAVIMDVGIGNGLMIKKFHNLIKRKNLTIIGLDINPVYLDHCLKLVKKYRLERNIKLINSKLEEYSPDTPHCFDYIIFSMSLMLLKDREDAIETVKSLLKQEGQIIFSQVEFEKENRFFSFIKPKLKFFTTIDFGEAIYRDEFMKFLESNSLMIQNYFYLSRNFFKGEHVVTITGVCQVYS